MTITEVGQVASHLVPDPVALGHRENCLCLKALRALPAMMMDERRVAVVPLLDSSLLDLLARKLEDEGAPMVRTYTRRWNEAGEGIGPDMRIRRCDALLFWRVKDRVLTVMERTAERQR